MTQLVVYMMNILEKYDILYIFTEISNSIITELCHFLQQLLFL